MNERERVLWEAAMRVRLLAYAPYSRYLVGAAVLGSDGHIYVGCNVENISLGLTICAERNAIAQMVASGCMKHKEIMIVTKDSGTPCGACRQVLLEFAEQADEVLVHCYNEDSQGRAFKLSELLPFAFQSDLPGQVQ